MNKQIIEPAKIVTQIKKLESVADLSLRLSMLKNIKDKIHDRKEAILKPLRESMGEIRDLFKPIEDAITLSEGQIKQSLLDQEKARQKAQKALAKDVKNGIMTMEDAAFESTLAPQGLYRNVKRLVISDESKVPDEYWEINQVALRAALMDGIKVPGAKLVTEKTVVAR